MPRLKAKCSNGPLLAITRSRQWKKHLVYILSANKWYKYRSRKRSHIIYIGTTGKGGTRPATSAVDKASQVFYRLRGVKTVEVHLVTCAGKKATPTWKRLESALLHAFEQRHYQLPKFNKQRPAFDEQTDIPFNQQALQKIIARFEP